ncbi:MAG TPA: acetyl-CoA carboxylase biotin carboxyl carrier protein [Candidatus Ozemobacteraceae bacterium]
MAKSRRQQKITEQPSSTESSNSALFTEVADIIRLMGESGLAELDLETPDLKVALRRQPQTNNGCVPITTNGQPTVTFTAEPAIPPIIPALVPSAPHQAHPPAPVRTVTPAKPATVEPSYHKIVSPMAGTFYRSPSPSAPPFTKIGDDVKAGQPVCIVEAMKLMNEIKADKAGKIVQILVENGKPVEKGTPLFAVEPGA